MTEKKTTKLLLAFFILSTFTMYGQSKKKQEENERARFYSGLNLFAFGSLSEEKTKIDVRPNDEDERNAYFSIIPNIGYRLNNSLLIGVAGGLKRNTVQRTVSANSTDYFEKETLKVARIYFIKEFDIKHAKLFIQINFDYTNERKTIEQNSPGSSGGYSHRADYFSPSLFPGLKTKLSPRIDAEFTYGIIGYSVGKLTTDPGGTESNYDLKRWELNFRPNTITLGIKYHFFKQSISKK